MAKVIVPKVPVARPEPLGNKHLNRTAKEFLARVAECLLRLLIRQSDLAFLIYHDHCVRGCFDHPTEALFADLQLRREMRRSDRVAAQLITKRDHDAQICEAAEKRVLYDSQDH